MKKKVWIPIASVTAVLVVLGVVTGMMTHSQKIVPVLGGHQRNVDLSQVPEHVRLSIEAIESFDNSMKANMIAELTKTRENVLSKPVYHVVLSGEFHIQQSLTHQSGQRFPQIQRLVLSIPADDGYVSLQGYANKKMVYEKLHLAVVNKQWTFSGNNSLWQATYTVDSSTVAFPQYQYAQMKHSHYELRYLGKNSSSIGLISYKFTFPNEGFSSNHTRFPSSGVIARGAGLGGGIGGLADYSGENGTLKVTWENKNAVVPLNMSKPSNGGN